MKPNLAVALEVQKAAKKRKKPKMAEGGFLDGLVKQITEPEPTKKPGDKGYVNRDLPKENTKKFVKGFNNGYAEGGEVMNKPKISPVARPRFVNGAFKVRDRADVEMEEHQMASMPPASPKEQPPKRYDEEGADRQGPSVPALEMKMMAEGGDVALEFDDQPEHEAEEDHHASVAAAIMAKRQKYAEGGEINGMDSIYADDSDRADLARNAEEDANMEDQASFDALRKENYSESEGLKQLDQPNDSNLHGDDIEHDRHDRVSAIRRRMRSMR